MHAVERCSICKSGSLHAGHATVTLERGRSVIVIRGVPAMVCDQCGEYYLDETTTKAVMERAAVIASSGTEVGVLQYSST